MSKYFNTSDDENKYNYKIITDNVKSLNDHENRNKIN